MSLFENAKTSVVPASEVARLNGLAVVGSPEQVTERVIELREAGIDVIVGYVADGIKTGVSNHV